MFYRVTGIFALFILLGACGTKNEQPDFANDIAPLIYKNCSKCHSDGAGGPFNLTNYQEVASKGNLISYVTENRIMPPWPADPEYSHFSGETILSRDEIELIKTWVKNGMPAGDTTSLEPYKRPERKMFPKGPSMLVKLPTPFRIKGNNTDHFFVARFPIALDHDTFLEAVEFIPSQKRLVHHMNAHLITYDEGKSNQKKTGKYWIRQDQAESVRIHQDLDLLYEDGSYPPMTPSVCNYLPGSQFSYYPHGIGGYKLKKNSAFYLNDIHFGPSPVDVEDSSYFRLYFTSKAPTRPVSEFQIGTLGIAPVTPELVIPANEVKTFRIKFTVPEDISVLSLVPHMHLIGKKFLAYALKPSGDTIRLIRINNWDFRWQYFYQPPTMLPIPRGSTIYVEGVYDNTSSNPNNPFSPPRQIADRDGSMKTTDEMFQLIITYVPYQKGDELKKLGIEAEE